ncbi:nodal homolog 2-A-like [Ostrea edulis]|uniref:nodal homolog 2-A-like n=1 Tax=Ostrea edulis TaxID=37623 RepID=UPI0024AEB0D9|nr:nodal homolog 2-A-like [Ostrea edulis]
MAKLSFLTNFTLFLHSVFGATVKEHFSEDFSPHVSLLSSAKPFPLDEHLDGTAQLSSTSTKFISTFYQNLLDGHSLSQAAQTRNNLGDVNTIRAIAPTGDLRTAVFKIPALQPEEDIHHIELRFNSNTARGRWLQIEIKRSNKTIRTHTFRVSNNSDITAVIQPWVSKNEDKLHVEVKQTSTPKENGILLIFSNDKSHLNKLSAISNVSSEVENELHSRSRRSTRRRRKDCHLSNMHINFSHLGWGKYIIFPNAFNARVCKGICAARVAEVKAVTNHAMMQSLLRQYRKGKIPLPCCVPKVLTPLSMLYAEDGKIIVKHHKNMVAKECGCE